MKTEAERWISVGEERSTRESRMALKSWQI